MFKGAVSLRKHRLSSYIIQDLEGIISYQKEKQLLSETGAYISDRQMSAEGTSESVCRLM